MSQEMVERVEVVEGRLIGRLRQPVVIEEEGHQSLAKDVIAPMPDESELIEVFARWRASGVAVSVGSDRGRWFARVRLDGRHRRPPPLRTVQPGTAGPDAPPGGQPPGAPGPGPQGPGGGAPDPRRSTSAASPRSPRSCSDGREHPAVAREPRAQDRRRGGDRTAGLGGEGAGGERSRRRGQPHRDRDRRGGPAGDPRRRQRSGHAAGGCGTLHRAPCHQQDAYAHRPLHHLHHGVSRRGAGQHRRRLPADGGEPARRGRRGHASRRRGRCAARAAARGARRRDHHRGPRLVLQHPRTAEVPAPPGHGAAACDPGRRGPGRRPAGGLLPPRSRRPADPRPASGGARPASGRTAPPRGRPAPRPSAGVGGRWSGGAGRGLPDASGRVRAGPFQAVRRGPAASHRLSPPDHRRLQRVRLAAAAQRPSRVRPVAGPRSPPSRRQRPSHEAGGALFAGAGVAAAGAGGGARCPEGPRGPGLLLSVR